MKITAVQNKNPKTLGRLALCLLILGFSFSELASAATVAYVGSETGLPGNDYSVQNWSNAGVAKAWNLSASEVYGSSGYIQIRPTSTVTPVRLEVSAGAGNDFGVNESTNPSLLSKPNFIGPLTASAGSFVNLGSGDGYSIRQLVETLKEFLDFEYEFDTSKPAGFPRRVMDIARAREWIDYNPQMSLRDGLEETWKWFQGNQDEYLSKQNYFK